VKSEKVLTIKLDPVGKWERLKAEGV